MSQFSVKIEVSTGSSLKEVQATYGENLRGLLVRSDLSPHGGVWKGLNCKGNGVCGSCHVLVDESGTTFRRRSCQIRCFRSMKIKLETQ